jgi:AcrR family transcriptional regulator
MPSGSSQAPHPLIRWIHPPQQGRSQQTLDRLLDAAGELLMTRGFDEITVPEIVSRAESSVGAFYARLKDKDGLLHALHQRTCDDAYATMEKGLDPADWEGAGVAEIIEVFVASLVELNRQRPGLLLAVLDRARVDAEMRNRHEAVRRYIGHRLTNLLLARRREIRHPDLGAACDFAVRQIYAVTRTEVYGLGGAFGGDPLPEDHVVRELTRSVLAYLGVRNDEGQ